MEPAFASDDAFKNYCSDEDENGSTTENYEPKRLIEGINLTDLCDGKEVVFEFSGDQTKNFFEKDEDDELNEFVHFNPKSLREIRGAHFLNCTFETLANKMFNVTDDGFVKKQIITNGTGKVVSDNAFVSVHYNLYKESSELPFDSTFLRNRPEKFRLDQGEAILGLELAIKTMKKHENSCFFIKWQMAFGELGCPDRIEKKCDIVADITLLNFDEICSEENLDDSSINDVRKVDFQKSLNKAKQLHISGSESFKRGDISGAILSYKKAVRILNNLRLANEEEESLMLKQKIKILVNLAVCYNKLGKNEQACVACQEVLSIDCNNVKALFHYGKANLALSNFSKAQKLLINAKKLKPNDSDINLELKKLNDKKVLFELKDQMFWKKAFKNEDSTDKTSKDISVGLQTFEKKLRDCLERCLDEKPFVLPEVLLPEEKEICSNIAKSMNLTFETQEDISIFKRKP